MMFADIFYDGASMVQHARHAGAPGVALAPVEMPPADSDEFDTKERGYMTEPDSPVRWAPWRSSAPRS